MQITLDISTLPAGALKKLAFALLNACVTARYHPNAATKPLLPTYRLQFKAVVNELDRRNVATDALRESFTHDA